MDESKEKQQTITIKRRLRPIRLGFLVSPNDVKTFRRVIQINTCLWGGKFNPIIPFFKKTPSFLVQGKYKPSGRSIVEGYIAGFSPDYLVVENPENLKGLAYPVERIVRFEEILKPDDKQPLGFGIDVAHVYDDLYQKEFKFVRRHPVEVILPISKNKLPLFYAAFYGEFPPDPKFSYLIKAYVEGCGAKKQIIDPTKFYTDIFKNSLVPISTGSVFLERVNSDWEGPQLFFMDHSVPLDLIDFWNLRASGRGVIPLPKQLAVHSIGELSIRITKNYNNHKDEWDRKARIIISRSCKLDEVQEFIAKLEIPTDSIAIQHGYPRVWNEGAREEAHEDVISLTADEDSVTVVSSNERISFSNLSPKFIDKIYAHRTPRWINVVNLSYQDELNGAPVIPPGIPDLSRILREGAIHPTWATNEGMVVPCGWRDSYFWQVPTPSSLFQAYMQGFGFEFEISSAGKITLEVLRSLGGIWGVTSFSNEEVLRKMEEMAHGVAESETDDPQKRKTRAATVSYKTWWALLQRVNEGNVKIAKNHLMNLFEAGVFRSGLKLQCLNCSQHTWFSLEQLAKDLTCERCLQKFPFPIEPPSQESWHYRTIGPFSIEGYAQGSYCTLLTSNFLFGMHSFHGEVSWMPSFILKSQKHIIKEAEIDFAAFWRPVSFEKRTAPVLMLGECKTFDKFTADEVKRMGDLAEIFPGAIIVFGTLRKFLDDKEKELISALVRKGRKHLRGERLRNPIMVLTGVELLNRMGPPSCWKDAGMPYAKFADAYHYRRNIQELCNSLQEMHLGIESYRVWYERELQKKQIRQNKVKKDKDFIRVNVS